MPVLDPERSGQRVATEEEKLESESTSSPVTVEILDSVTVCALIRCAGSDPSSCGQGVEEAETKMDFVMEGKFGTRYVYPSVLASQMVLEEVKHFDKSADGRVTLKHSDMTAGLVTACLYGRMYHLDHE
ncbi:biotinidase-like isoform X3 [Xyrichtys novacula]|uniref:Biotinidase-like isoform X3 n=1 Tax=Xyrichtys novacula TaxID=13765 RepID=A0AAV1GVU1_XYRNO|nr:biotinidase-like isoform X3 [Xyrichtys novacula]